MHSGSLEQLGVNLNLINVGVHSYLFLTITVNWHQQRKSLVTPRFFFICLAEVTLLTKIFKLLKKYNIQSFLFGLLGGFLVFILLGIDYTLSGSLAEWLSAVGTIGAVMVSLWLAKDKKNSSDIVGNCFESSLSYHKKKESEIVFVNPQEEIPDYLEFTGSVQFFNPSDFPRTIYSLKTHFIFYDKDEIQSLDTFEHTREKSYRELHYISLAPKETKIVFLKQHINRNDVENDFHSYEFEPHIIYVEGINEKNEAIRISLYN